LKPHTPPNHLQTINRRCTATGSLNRIGVRLVIRKLLCCCRSLFRAFAQHPACPASSQMRGPLAEKRGSRLSRRDSRTRQRELKRDHPRYAPVPDCDPEVFSPAPHGMQAAPTRRKRDAAGKLFSPHIPQKQWNELGRVSPADKMPAPNRWHSPMLTTNVEMADGQLIPVSKVAAYPLQEAPRAADWKQHCGHHPEELGLPPSRCHDW